MSANSFAHTVAAHAGGWEGGECPNTTSLSKPAPPTSEAREVDLVLLEHDVEGEFVSTVAETISTFDGLVIYRVPVPMEEPEFGIPKG
ncbi:hypothetical protein TcWFU_001741 [Taenia crassiceps]|uniref:Uncharacterized protein n=1 Tax=Taenia crassiceps TaxID=6207 RepID=A0ABR4QPQ5_9CEST